MARTSRKADKSGMLRAPGLTPAPGLNGPPLAVPPNPVASCAERLAVSVCLEVQGNCRRHRNCRRLVASQASSRTERVAVRHAIRAARSRARASASGREREREETHTRAAGKRLGSAASFWRYRAEAPEAEVVAGAHRGASYAQPEPATHAVSSARRRPPRQMEACP